MKKTLILVRTCLVLCLIGIIAVWYFGPQSSDQEEAKSNSNNSLRTENRPQDRLSVPEPTQKTDKGDMAEEIEAKKKVQTLIGRMPLKVLMKMLL